MTTRPSSSRILVVILLAALFAATSAAGGNSPEKRKHLPTMKLTLGTATIEAEVANTDESKISGLLGWSTISDREGLLLDFGADGTHAIHMQGMKFPIDAVWIDSANKITLIYPSIQPNSGLIYPSMIPAAFCLELQAGFCKKFGVKVGQKVVFGASSGAARK
jgi:uncharacterized membrane protein (UPF0127 family)